MKFLLVETSAFLLLAYACANPGKSDSTNSNTQEAPSADAAPSTEDQSVGNIAFQVPAGLLDLQGYIVGSSEQVSLRPVPNASGSVGFVGVAPGTYEMILTARKIQPNGSSAPVAIRLSGVIVNGGKVSLLPSPDLKATIDLKGKVELDGQPAAAVTIQIPGTHYRVPSDANGEYTLASIPVGYHAIEISQPGFETGGISSQGYRDSATLPSISLMAESEARNSGVYYLGPAMAEGSSDKIVLYLKSPKGLTHFRYTVDGGLETKAWQILQSSLEIDMPTGKNPSVSVQFSNAGQQLSPNYAVTIPTE